MVLRLLAIGEHNPVQAETNTAVGLQQFSEKLLYVCPWFAIVNNPLTTE